MRAIHRRRHTKIEITTNAEVDREAGVKVGIETRRIIIAVQEISKTIEEMIVRQDHQAIRRIHTETNDIDQTESEADRRRALGTRANKTEARNVTSKSKMSRKSKTETWKTSPKLSKTTSIRMFKPH